MEERRGKEWIRQIKKKKNISSVKLTKMATAVKCSQLGHVVTIEVDEKNERESNKVKK